MDRWIRDLINAAISGLTGLINGVVDRLAWVYNVIITFFIKVRTGFDGALNGLRSKLVALHGLAGEIYTTLRWIVITRIPQIVGNAVTNAVNYVIAQINNVGQFLRGLIDGLSDWAWRQIQRIDAFVDQVIRWVTGKLNAITDTLDRVVDIVMNLLTDPKRLAAWVIDAVTDEFLRWLNRNADRIFLVVRQRSVHYTMMFADRIEDMIARLL